MEKIYTPEMAAEMLHVSPLTLRKWLREGKIKGFKVNGSIWRIPEAELEKFVQNSVSVDGKR